ncbi:carbamoyltransferase HypF [Magnetococcales bacterium HHB-1]
MIQNILSQISSYSAQEQIMVVIDLKGAVQGVGFRPMLYRWAKDLNLGGGVCNRNHGVRLTLEGSKERIEHFLGKLQNDLKKPAKIKQVQLQALHISKVPAKKFTINKSERDPQALHHIPLDRVPCRQCREEIEQSQTRYFRYALTTCTACGPRFTQLYKLPYDRHTTAMASFKPCKACQSDYLDPDNRRFHAENIACTHCGPQLRWLSGKESTEENAIQSAKEALQRGEVIIIKGVGGYQLAVDATSISGIEKLRKIKRRPHKALVVMVPDLSTASKLCKINDVEAKLLTSPAGPIVILNRHATPLKRWQKLWSPDHDHTIGLMLPSSPLHQQLFDHKKLMMLIITSANHPGEPTCYRTSPSDRVEGVLDYNREIVHRNDDSLAVIRLGEPQVLRLARGYAPTTFLLNTSLHQPWLAIGAEFKNAFALGEGNQAVMAPHLGDLQSLASVDALEAEIEKMIQLTGIKPQGVAVDLHPDLNATNVGLRFAEKYHLPIISVQHHHAHARACMAEHNLEHALAIVWDGLGLGEDHTLWGGELLEVTPEGYQRLASFLPTRLPGGDHATRHPLRQLVGRFHTIKQAMPEPWLKRLAIDPKEERLWRLQCKRGMNAPISHAAGRLLDSFSTLLGLVDHTISYDSQAAVRLESAAHRASKRNIEKKLKLSMPLCHDYPMPMIDWRPAFKTLIEKGPFFDPSEVEDIALLLHRSLCDAGENMAEWGRRMTGLNQIVLTGGLFLNQFFAEQLPSQLEKRGFEVFSHRRLPPHDGNIALGQLCAVAAKGSRSCVLRFQ